VTVAIALFTRDLRIRDNPVLHRAAASADRVIPLFVVDTGIARTGYLRPNRSSFLVDCLSDLDAGLRELGGCLVVRRGEVVEEVARLVTDHDVAAVHVARDVSGYAQRREHALATRLSELGCELRVHDDVITVVPPGAVVATGADHSAVFTPYHRQWTDVSRRAPLPPPSRLGEPPASPEPLPTAADLCPGPVAPALPRGGEHAARLLLDQWREQVRDYVERQDDLAGDATSHLSAHLHFGSLSPTELVHVIGTATPAARAFVRQLAWRDFNHQLMAARPDTARHDYRQRDVTWRDAPADLDQWKAGRTGHPIVDAGMRQLLHEGWLHNRARLIVGSFLTKTLRLDWRLGAQHFLDHLVDADIANNQLNWQWVAGTGTDTRPYRTLNPLRQAERHDTTGDYVRRYVPELAHLPVPAIHQPWTLPSAERNRLSYPPPMVDLAAGRTRLTTRSVPPNQGTLF
jgi:deoxyribodipyrimidine photo-lyase